MSNSNFFTNVVEDFKVFRKVYKGNPLFLMVYHPSFKVVFIYRLSNLFYKLFITRPLAYLLTMLNDFLHGVWIPSSTKIGKGLFLGHPRGLIINPSTQIGSYCSLLQQVTLGGPRTIIGDYVSINAGGKVISNKMKDEAVVIGKNCIIAAGAVVLKSMPENSIIGGMPAKVLKTITENENWYNERNNIN